MYHGKFNSTYDIDFHYLLYYLFFVCEVSYSVLLLMIDSIKYVVLTGLVIKLHQHN